MSSLSLKIRPRENITNGKFGACWDTLISDFFNFRPRTSHVQVSRNPPRNRPEMLGEAEWTIWPFRPFCLTLRSVVNPISDMGQTVKMFLYRTGAHASVSSASERYNMKLWIDLVLTHPIRGSSTVEWRRRVRGGAGAPGFGSGAFPMVGSADRGGH